MKRGPHVIASVCMLLALALSLAEGVAATMCALEMDATMAGMEMSVDANSNEHHEHGAHCGSSHHDEESAPGVPDCPLGFPVGSCLSPAALPTATVAQLASLFEHDIPLFSPDVLAISPASSAVFHPPKA